MLEDETNLFSSRWYIFNDTVFILMLKWLVVRFFENWENYAWFFRFLNVLHKTTAGLVLL